MAKKRHKAEEIVAKLRQVDALIAQGASVSDAITRRFRTLPVESAPSESKPVSLKPITTSISSDEQATIRRWYWATVALGAISPIVGTVGLALAHWKRFGNAGDLSGPVNFLGIMVINVGLSIVPFVALAEFVRKKLAQTYSSRAEGLVKRTQFALGGTIVGAFAPYSLFYLLIAWLPLGSTGRFDWSGLWQAVSIYLWLVLPISATVTGFLGYWCGVAVSKLTM